MVDASPQPRPRRRTPLTPSVSAGQRLDMLEAAMRQVAEGVVIVDRKGRFVFWNEAAQSIVGTGPLAGPPSEWSSVYGCFLPDKVTPYPSRRAASRPGHARRARPRGGDLHPEPAQPPRAPGSASTAPPCGTRRARSAGGVIVFRDVTAHRRSHEVVRQLSKALEKTTDAVFVTDPNAVIEYVNPAFEAITGYTQEQAIGQRPSILKSGRVEPGFYERLWKRILAGDVHSGTLVNRKRSGELFHAEQTITPVSDDDGTASRTSSR